MAPAPVMLQLYSSWGSNGKPPDSTFKKKKAEIYLTQLEQVLFFPYKYQLDARCTNKPP